MDSIKGERLAEPVTSNPGAHAPPARSAPPPLYDLIELMFFAYRDFVSDPDRLLETFDFGRAHHRVLHFVHRQPGLSIAELLEILKITKQSLNRVLKDLLDTGFVIAKPGDIDRRQRQLFATESGTRLALQLAQVQTERFSRALNSLGEGGNGHARAFLLSMIDASERPKVTALLERAK